MEKLMQSLHGKKWLKNYLYFGMSILALSFFFGILISMIFQALKFKAAPPIGDIIAAVLMAQLYAKKFNQTIPKHLRFKTALVVVVIEIALALIFRPVPIMVDVYLFIGLLLVFGLIDVVVIYWILGYASEKFKKS